MRLLSITAHPVKGHRGLLPDSLRVPETWYTLAYLPIYQRTNRDKHIHSQGKKMT